MKIYKKHGFTLAEVLITLGIIGVVAALTIPVLMKATNNNTFRTGFKKAISCLNQAIGTNIALISNADFSTMTAGNFGVDGSIANMFDVRLKTYKTTLVEDPDLETAASVKVSSASNYTLFINDGMVLGFPQDAQNCTRATWKANDCVAIIDVNGIKSPNKLTNCSSPIATADNTACTSSNVAFADRFSLRFFDGIVESNGNAGRYILGNNAVLEK